MFEHIVVYGIYDLIRERERELVTIKRKEKFK